MPRLNAVSRLSLWKFIFPAFLMAAALNVSTLRANDVDGFTEPYRTINVSAAEQGVITELFVKEGDAVHKDQVLATLDTDVLEASKEIAKAGKESMGRIKSAEAVLKLKKERMEKLKELQGSGYAHPEEILRGEMELDMARAELQSAKEDQNIKDLECTRIETQIGRRTIISPIDGFVTKLHKEVSEYVAATDPVVLTVVQCDQLKIVFSVPASEVHRFSVGQKVSVKFVENGESAEGVIELVSPVTDPESSTVRVKVVLDNSQKRYRSGMSCILPLGTMTQAASADK